MHADRKLKMHLVISLINVRPNTGAFTVLKLFCDAASEISDIDTTVLCHSIEDIQGVVNSKRISFIEYPLSQKSWIFRCFYEYVYFYFLAKRLKPDYWLSLHDMTPNIGRICPQSVYCHNPIIFYKAKLRDLYFSPSIFLFSLFYKHLYKINIKKNDYIIVQQEWIRNEFIKMFKPKNVLVSLPANPEPHLDSKYSDIKTVPGRFIYASRSRSYKNFEVICQAACLLYTKGYRKIQFVLTIDKDENKYSRFIVEKYGKCPLIKFVGCLDKETLYEYYASSDAMIFPSHLETWGLGITEFKAFDKPIFIADLKYAHETLGEYSKAITFNPNNPNQLAEKIAGYVEGTIQPSFHSSIKYSQPVAFSIQDTLRFLLNSNFSQQARCSPANKEKA